jgi:phospholipid/cholesterol/gamma-HCH transport system substrate-binding protein
MPSLKKVRWAELKVGILAVVSLSILALLIFLLTGEKSIFERNATLYTYLDDSAALAAGAPVRLNGIVIGKVEQVELSGSNQPSRIVRVRMRVQEQMLRQIPVDSQAMISAENVLGSKHINITKGRDPQTVKEGSEIKALDTQEFAEVVQSSYDLLTSLRGILKRIDAIVGDIESGRGSIGKFLRDDEFYNRLVGTVAETQKVAAAVSNRQGTVGKLLYDDALYNDVRGATQKIDALLNGVNAGEGTAGKLLKDQALYDEMRSTIGELRTLAQELNAGKGTAGKLLKDDALYAQLNTTLNKLDGTIDRINSGSGTIGQLLVNPSLYENLTGSTQEMQALLKDIRANPKKFLRIKLALF